VRRLRDFQPVRVHGIKQTVDARVVSVHGDQAILDAGEPLEDLDGFADQALLAFEHAGRMITLSGAVLRGSGPGLLRFLCTDGVRLADKRQHERLSITLPVSVATLDGTPAVPAPGAMQARAPAALATQAADISAGGLLLTRDGLSGVLRVTVTLPGVAEPITAIAEVIRTGVPGTAVMFRSIAPQDQALIHEFVGSVKHALAKRFAATPAGASAR
jgi:hypothetical protein